MDDPDSQVSLHPVKDREFGICYELDLKGDLGNHDNIGNIHIDER